MKKLILMILSVYLFPDIFVWQKMLIEIILEFSSKLICKDLEMYFNEYEAKTRLRKWLLKQKCSFCGA